MVLPFFVFVVQPRKNKRLPEWVCHGRVLVKSKRVPVAELCLCSCNAHAKYFFGLSKSRAERQIVVTRKKKNTRNTIVSWCRPSGTVLCMLCNKVKTWFSQNTFLLPPCYGQHQHVWQKLDIDTVGCKICGVLHCCSCSKNIVPCQKEFQNDTSVVCLLTGIVLQDSSLFVHNCSKEEYRSQQLLAVNTAHAQACTSKTSLIENIESTRQQISQCISLLLYSEKAQDSRVKECTRLRKKVNIVFSANVTAQHAKRKTVDVLEALESSILFHNKICRDVQVEIPDFSYWEFFIDHAAVVLTSFNLPRQCSTAAKHDNYKNLIIAYIYMARIGLVIKNVQIVPAVPLLDKLLPLEILMWSCFDIPSKIITEVRKCCKRVLRLVC